MRQFLSNKRPSDPALRYGIVPAGLLCLLAVCFGPLIPRLGFYCYLYQKADLARQLGEWDRVVAIGDQAAGAGYTIHNSESNTPFEWLPFIEGYARLGHWEEAAQITRDAVVRDSRIAPRMCRVWSTLQAEGYSQVGSVMSELNCAP